MPVDSRQKATEIRFCSLKRPHMRGFWSATLGFFMAFIGWFAMAPLMTTIKKDLGLTKDEVYNSNILGVAATIPARLIVGPLCDRFGPRKPMAWCLIICSIPLGCAALVHDAVGLYIVRFLIGFVGATFIPCQYWTTAMFTGRIVGSANALAGGWGNLGGGVTQGLTVGFLEMFKACGLSESMAWRMSLVVPAVVWVIVGFLILMVADDCPVGKWRNLPKTEVKYSVWTGIKGALKEPFTYILIVSYACGFGVELHVNKSIAAYFEAKWKLDTTTAGLIATLSGLMNLFSRATGGFLSDRAARRWFLRGRMWVIVLSLLFSGAFLCVMSSMKDLWSAILLLVIFSIFCQASCGAVYGLVPFVSLEYGGIVSGFIGAGGNLGAMCWGFVHKSFGATNNEDTSYLVIGCLAMGSALLVFCGRLHGAAIMPCLGNDGKDTELELSKLKFDDHDSEKEKDPESQSTEEDPLSFEAAYEVGEPSEVAYYPSDVAAFTPGFHPPTPQVDTPSMADFEPGRLPTHV